MPNTYYADVYITITDFSTGDLFLLAITLRAYVGYFTLVGASWVVVAGEFSTRGEIYSC